MPAPGRDRRRWWTLAAVATLAAAARRRPAPADLIADALAGVDAWLQDRG
jgi:hypothetical protein